MIGNFMIDNLSWLTESNFQDLGFNPVIKNWEQNPISTIFRANMTGARYLHRLGDSYSFEIELYGLTEAQFNAYLLPLNGTETVFQMDADSVEIPVNIVITPTKYGERNILDIVNIQMESIEPLTQTSSEKLTSAPVIVSDVTEKKVIVVNDKILRYGR